jgi:hypothetical protein
VSSYLSWGVSATLVPDAGAWRAEAQAAGRPGRARRGSSQSGPVTWLILRRPSGRRAGCGGPGRAGSGGAGDDVRGPGGHGPGEGRQVLGGAGGRVAAGSGAAWDAGSRAGREDDQDLFDQAVAAGLVMPGGRRRLMSLPFIMRVVVAMTLLPDSDYPEVIRSWPGCPGCRGREGGRSPRIRRSPRSGAGSADGRWSSCSGGSPGRWSATARRGR